VAVDAPEEFFRYSKNTLATTWPAHICGGYIENKQEAPSQLRGGGVRDDRSLTDLADLIW